jgi:hypothetical protein
MTHFTRIVVVFLVAAAALCAPHVAQAAVRTASISVSAEVIDTCSITVSGVVGASSASCARATPYRIVTSTAAAYASANSDATVSTNSSSDQANRQNADTSAVMTIIF